MSRQAKIHLPINLDFTQVLTAIANENMPAKTFTAHPFIKWVGGKRSIINELLQRIPKQYSSYHEPFLGGGALFFALSPEKVFLSDINFYLIVTYTAIRDRVEEVICNLKIHKKNHKLEYYQKARIKLGKEQEQSKIAALFIYLNKTCYNGLYRVNKSGLFNVPMGKYTDPAILDEDNLRACSKFLQNTIIKQHSFVHCHPQKDQFYYLDPPYHETFSSYDGSGFKDKEHEKLAEFCNKINKKQGFFMLSNSDTPFVRGLYKGYNVEIVSASRFISCKANDRNKQNELIIRNY
jgi:DNA adenine methylase